MVATTASPSLPSISPALADVSTMGPRTRVSSGSIHTLLPRRHKTPAIRAFRRFVTDTISPSAPRLDLDTMRATTVSPWSAPPSPSAGTKMSSAIPGVFTNPNPLGFTDRIPDTSVPRRSTCSRVSRKRWPGMATTLPSNDRSSRSRCSPGYRRSSTPSRVAISLM
jgi:hypothetical protein